VYSLIKGTNQYRVYAERVDIVFIAMIKSLWFVPMFVVARADLPTLGQDRINVIGKPSALAGG
jgi:hypothetical protein